MKMMNYAIQKAWARIARKAVEKALQDVRIAEQNVAVASVESKRLEAEYKLVVRTTASALAEVSAVVQAAKAARAKRRKIVRLTAEAKAETARLKAAENAAYFAWQGVKPFNAGWALRNAVIALREAKLRAFWAEVDAYGLFGMIEVEVE